MLSDSSTSSPIIQLMRPGASGDVLMTTATFPGLKAQGYRIRMVVHPNYANVIDNNPLIDELIVTRTANREAVLKATEHLEKAEKAIYLRYPFYAKRDLPEHPIPMHITSYFCDAVGVPRSDQLHVELTDDELVWGEQYKEMLLIHTATLWSPYKNWPSDRWQKLIQKIKKNHDIEIRQIGGPKDEAIDGVEKIQSPSIRHAIAALKFCRLFIGLDSVFNHAAQALKKPAIILWGSTHPQGHGYSQNINLVNGVVWQAEMGTFGPALNCQPCYREYSGPGNNNNQRACPYTVPYPHHELPKKMHQLPEINACMATQSFESVYYHVNQMLNNQPVTQPIRDDVLISFA